MNFAYDYNNIIKDLKQELNDGTLTLETNIQILRGNIIKDIGYAPVVDYYYASDDMKEIFDCAIKEEKELIKNLENQYNQDKPRLKSSKVKHLLYELELVGSPLGVSLKDLDQFISHIWEN